MTFTRTTTLLATVSVAAAIALAACGHSKSGADVSTHSGSFTIRDGQVIITSKGAPDALISPEGRLTIDGQAITLTEGQRAQLVTYFNAANGVVHQAAATGVAGAQVGSQRRAE